MDPESRKFGRGTRELTGAVDLISHYKLLGHHDFFCKKLLPLSISGTHYLHNVAGDTEIRKGDGMELEQLFQNAQYLGKRNGYIRPFDLDILGQAFQLRETSSIDLPSADKGVPTCSVNSKDERQELKKQKKLKDKEYIKHKHRHSDKNKDSKGKDKGKSGQRDSSGDHLKKQPDKLV